MSQQYRWDVTTNSQGPDDIRPTQQVVAAEAYPDAQGNLNLTTGDESIAIFARGEWSSVVRVEPAQPVVVNLLVVGTPPAPRFPYPTRWVERRHFDPELII